MAHTTPNMGIVGVPDTDNDPFDELVLGASFDRIDTLWGPNGPGATMKLIYDNRLAVDSAGWDVQNIPGNPGDDLILSFDGRSTFATVDDSMLRFNNDSAANHYEQAVISVANAAASAFDRTVAHGNALAQIWFDGANSGIGGADDGANRSTVVEATIRNYAGVDFYKNVLGRVHANRWNGVNDIDATLYGANWLSVAAINRITISMLNGNVKTGSRLTIWRRAAA